jgi:hypothetical protein
MLTDIRLSLNSNVVVFRDTLSMQNSVNEKMVVNRDL